MAYTPHVYLYYGATCEDVQVELDDKPYDYLDLELMASPQCRFVALEYSEEKVRELALEMWEGIKKFYQEDEHGSCVVPITLDSLRVITSARVCEHTGSRSCKDGFEGPLPVAEITVLDYYHPIYNTIEPLMKIVVQMRPVR